MSECVRHTILAADSYALSLRRYVPSNLDNKTLQGGVIINSATAVPQTYYKKFAEYLSAKGYVVLTYDYRGIAESAPRHERDREHLSMLAWGELDFSAVLDWAINHYADLNWHCIGHSVGGQLVGLAGNNTKLSSVYCVAAQSGFWGHWGWLERPKILFNWFVMVPVLSRLFGQVPAFFMGGEALYREIADEWGRWCRHPDYIVDQSGTPIRDGFVRLTCQMKFLEFSDDKDFAPASAVKALSDFYANASKEHEEITPQAYNARKIGHFGFFRQEFEQSLWPKVERWLLSTRSSTCSAV